MGVSPLDSLARPGNALALSRPRSVRDLSFAELGFAKSPP
jgi:hypothetical protein